MVARGSSPTSPIQHYVSISMRSQLVLAPNGKIARVTAAPNTNHLAASPSGCRASWASTTRSPRRANLPALDAVFADVDARCSPMSTRGATPTGIREVFANRSQAGLERKCRSAKGMADRLLGFALLTVAHRYDWWSPAHS